MRRISYAGKRYEVEIISLALPRDTGLMGRGHPMASQKPNLTLLCSIDLPLGARFTLENADEGELEATVLGRSPRLDGRFAIVGLVTC
jgi:hypothetical protein